MRKMIEAGSRGGRERRPGLSKSEKRLSAHELKKRAAKIKLMITDNDGVLTDAGVYYSSAGEEMKRFSIRDGMGVERLRLNGIETAIITGETSASIQRRAEKLQIQHLYLGVRNKFAHLETILKTTELNITDIAYIGDDVLDAEIMRAIGNHGLIAAPADGMPEINRLVHYQCELSGGHGAFREFAEWIIRLRNSSSLSQKREG